QNFQQPMNQQMPQQNFQQPMNQQMPNQNFQQPMNQQMPQQNFQQPMNQQMPQQNGQPQMSPEEFIKQQQLVRQEMKTAHTQIMKQPMVNTPQTMNTMKNLAQVILRNPQLSQHETALLQNFVNNPQQALSNQERRHLQNLMRLCQQNVPVTVQQAAVQQKLPDLPRLWAFMQLCDMAKLASSNMTGRQLRRAGKDVSDFANSMRSSMSNENFSTPVQQNQRSFQLMVPVYLNVNEISYPTYVNVYEEKNGTNENGGGEKKETWIRICVLTENIGAAELIFRVYDEDQLDMRFYFSQGETAGVFATYVDDLRESMKDVKLQIGEIRIGNVGSTMEQY
ncbi:MAG: hypothetical protein IJQ16_08590, partial [Selenomonadaceae bacterium]|nr:hypothetical protein [Selenomonadaceae bacterium]